MLYMLSIYSNNTIYIVLISLLILEQTIPIFCNDKKTIYVWEIFTFAIQLNLKYSGHFAWPHNSYQNIFFYKHNRKLT